ncbi:SWIM zinc finger family protein [Tuberibacillus calidus]|jgi:uncharacterized Zn finger protein|uniref:SWIM zinc finger family protein n=1 Tax=Tuberibacillus calidus TaxID=340097 RepID=UPI000428CD97|nr:SWIM zinc finger family protein [Tuberibacillus calidus]
MADLSTLVRDKDNRAWLKKFLSRVDRRRKAKAETLYLNGCVENLTQKAFGFTADVQGSHLYQVNAFFEDGATGGLPRIDQCFFTCTCPDSADYCKHIAAAVIKWVVHRDRLQSLAKRNVVIRRPASRPLASPSLEKLERLAKSRPPVRFEDPAQSDWPFQQPLSHLMQSIIGGQSPNALKN